MSVVCAVSVVVAGAAGTSSGGSAGGGIGGSSFEMMFAFVLLESAVEIFKEPEARSASYTLCRHASV